MDAPSGPEVFRRQRRVFRGRVRCGGTGLLARNRRRLQGPETGKPVARPAGFCETGWFLNQIYNVTINPVTRFGLKRGSQSPCCIYSEIIFESKK